MKIGFYLTGDRDAGAADAFRCAALLIASIRSAMPGVPIAQITDSTTLAAPGVDEVFRMPPAPMSVARPDSYRRLRGEWLFLDTDIIVRGDVRHVFDSKFDVAFADRNWIHMEPTPKLTAKMPYNAGVAFSRNPAFWEATLEAVHAGGEKWETSFMGDQLAIAVAAGWRKGERRSEPFQVLELPGMRYNYPPSGPKDPGIANALIVHYKGPRKAWMLDPDGPRKGNRKK